jgi:biopolymer transport protein ExbD
MPKHKIPRKSTSIDMTAMCDVAFLLLTFFMLTAKAKPDEPVLIDTPTSVSQLPIKDAGVAIITVDTAGRAYFDMIGQAKRDSILDYQKMQFRLGSMVGVPMESLPELMSKPASDRKDQPGIPVDSLNNQLADWVTSSLYLSQTTPFVIKADSKTKYPKIKKVIDILQAQNINKFSLLTGMEGDPRATKVRK